MRRVSRVSATGTRTPSSATTLGTTRAMNIGACTLTRRSRRLTRSPEVLVTTAEPWVRTPPRTFITLFFFARAPEPFFPDGARGSPRGDAPHRRCDRERPDRAVTPRRPRPSRIESDLYRPAPSTLDPQTRPSGGGVPRPSRCSATPVAPVTGGRTTSGPRPRWVAWPRRWRPKRGRPPDLLRRRSTRRRNTGARRPRSRASRTFVPTPCARDGSWLSWCRLSKGKGRDGDR